MQSTSITLASANAFAGSPFPISVGVPFPKGEATPETRFQGHLATTGDAVPTQSLPLAFWPDGSIRWLLVRFIIPAGETLNETIKLSNGVGRIPLERPAEKPAPAQGGPLQVRVGGTSYRFSSELAGWTQQQNNTSTGSTQSIALALNGPDGAACPVAETFTWKILEQGDVCTRVQGEGRFSAGQGSKTFNARLTLTLYPTGLAAIRVRLHNPHRARHSGGLWDLGDPGSLYFKSLTLKLTTDSPATPWLRPVHDQPDCFEGGSLRLHQESSGGENWNSRNHQDAEGRITPAWRGYQCQHQGSSCQTGDRATPVVGIGSGQQGLTAAMEDFWQNFPSAIAASEDEIQIDLFPEIDAGPHELQGGERKTQTVFISQDNPHAPAICAYAQPVPCLAPDVYARAQAFPWLNPSPSEDPLQPLIHRGVEGPHNFFRKREIIDEFGWRHFGELFADHETLYQAPTDPPFISHYNNQYDPVYGFARQFALTGDPRWHELMNDLARHVSDIDIYHTQEDRVEYSNGLFWHTDHYLDAHTATHRTFSRHNTTTSTGDIGGGPGAEHCYTSGLLYHYWMTGNEDSAETVLKLAQWLRSSFEQQDGLLAQVLAFKKQELPQLKSMVKGSAPLAHTYPFTRATGNYLNALLDAWLLTSERNWLDTAEHVIRHSIHPNDDPGQRNLLDVETGWSYLVLMTSLAKFLILKEQADERDANYAYTRHAMARYTRWMLSNERSFLAQTEQLEYPNQTWTAQDVRKAMLLYLARYIDPDHAENYQNQADEWLKASIDTLNNTPEAHYTRLLAILMQNHGAHTLSQNPGFSATMPALPERLKNAHSHLSWATLIQRMLRRAINGLIAFRPHKEKAWLQARLDR